MPLAKQTKIHQARSQKFSKQTKNFAKLRNFPLSFALEQNSILPELPTIHKQNSFFFPNFISFLALLYNFSVSALLYFGTVERARLPKFI